MLALTLHLPPNIAGDNLPEPLDGSKIAALHDMLRDTLRALVTAAPGDVVLFPSDGVSVGVVRATAVGDKPAIFGSTYGHREIGTALLHLLKDLVLQAGDRLIACPQCQAPFVVVRKQIFCSPDCAQQARNDGKAKLRFRKRG